MAETTVNLGMLPKNRGEYSSSATYYKDNIVQYNGSSYVCTAAMDLEHPSGITGIAPYDSDPATPNTGWAVFSNDSSGVGEGVYNVSVDHTTDNQPKVYASLSVALNDIPAAKQKGGMEIKFIFNNSDYAVDKEEGLTTQPAGILIASSPTMVDGTYKASQLLTYFSTLPIATGAGNAVVYYKEVDGTYTTWTITLQSSDNKYVQYRLMSQTFSTTESNWQGVDEEPTADSDNLVKSGGVAEMYGISVIDSADGFPYARRHMVGTSSPSSTGNRYTLGIPIKAGKSIVLQSQVASGVSVSIHNTFDAGCLGVVGTALQVISAYSTDLIEGKSVVDGVLIVKWKNLDESAITDSEIAEMRGSLSVNIGLRSGVFDEIDDLEGRKPSGVDFLAVYTEGFFNADDDNQVIHVPNFRVFMNNESYSFTAQDIDYPWVTPVQRAWFAIVLSEDNSSLITVPLVDIAGNKKVIAFIARKNSENNVSMFYGCSSDSQKESIWRVNGSTIYSKLIEKKIGKQDILVSSVDDLPLTRRHQVGSSTESSTGNRYTLGIKVTVGCMVEVQSSFGRGVIATVFATFDYGCFGSSLPDYGLRQRISGRYSKSKIVGRCNTSGVLIFKWAKEDDSAITDAEIAEIRSTLKVSVISPSGIVKDIKDIYNDAVISNNVLAISHADFPYALRHQMSTSVESPTGNRYTLGIPISAGTRVQLRSNVAAGITVGIYDTFEHGCSAIIAHANYCYQSFTSYTTEEINGFAIADGILIVKWKKADDSAITDNEIAEMQKSLLVLIEDATKVKDEVIDLRSKVYNMSTSPVTKKLLYTGVLVQKSVSGNAFSDSTVRVTQKCAIAVPEHDVKIHIKLPSNYCVGFKVAYPALYLSLNWDVDSGWLYNGDNYTISSSEGIFYRVYFGKDGGFSAITVADVQALIESGDIQLTYDSDDSNIIVRNSHNEHYIKGLMRKFTTVIDTDSGLNKMPVFTHISDIHGDAVRFDSFMRYSKFLKADAALLSGDIVPMAGGKDFTDFIDDIADKYDGAMMLPCMGNHDARLNDTEQAQNAVIASSIEKYGLVTPSGLSYPTYYYKDFTDKSIRLIALNLYYAGQRSTNEWRLTQGQITWFVNTLASTPVGYGVIVMMHSPETTTVKESSHEKFYQSLDTGTIRWNNAYLPIRKIVDAFISKTTFTGSFTETITGGVTETINIDADFTAVDSTTEFICYVTGHRHKDCIGLVDGATNRQLMCNIACGTSLYWIYSNIMYYADLNDVPRGGKGFTQDLMNVYVIDRVGGNIKIARVGSNMNQDFAMRDYMIMPYK